MCLNNRINLPDRMGLFASSTDAFLVAKNGTKKIIPLLWIKTSKNPQIKKVHKTNSPKVGNLIQNTILKVSKTKNLTQKRPPKFQKIKIYIRRP